MLTKVKDTLPLGKQSNVVYRIPYSCGQVYINWRDQTEIGDETEGTPRCLREGDDGEVSCSGTCTCVGEPTPDPETTVLDHGRGQQLLVKEARHIQMTPAEEHFNRDGGLEVPGCWTAVMRRQGGRSKHEYIERKVICYQLELGK